MAIVDTKILVRPNTSVPFFTDSGLPARTAAGTALSALRETGKYSSEYTVSEDQLTQTAVLTCADLETYSAYDTILGIALDSEYVAYLEEHDFIMLSKNTTPRVFTNTGIDQPFIVTHVYTFAENDPTMVIFSSSVSLEPNATVTVGTNTVTVVRQYANSDDFTENFFGDLRYVQQLHAKGVTRTITYAFVS